MTDFGAREIAEAINNVADGLKSISEAIKPIPDSEKNGLSSDIREGLFEIARAVELYTSTFSRDGRVEY